MSTRRLRESSTLTDWELSPTPSLKVRLTEVGAALTWLLCCGVAVTSSACAEAGAAVTTIPDSASAMAVAASRTREPRLRSRLTAPTFGRAGLPQQPATKAAAAES